MEWLGNIIGVLLLLAFVYFIYTRVKASKERRANRPPGSGGGGRRGPGDTHLK